MKIDIDNNSGFCFGVRNAVKMAEDALFSGEKLYSLGQIVHNDLEVDRLHKLGLQTINYEQFRQLKNCRVLIRAHGEPPETYKVAVENNITLIDATCPIVKKLQEKIRNTWTKLEGKGGELIIFGKPGHAEVLGLMGQTGNKATLTDGTINLDKIDYTREIHLFSQTTMNYADYNRLAMRIKEKIKENGITDPDNNLFVHHTICRQVRNLQPALKNFASSHDIIIFVSGKESSNGKVLFEICKKNNPESYFISSPDEIRKEWFDGKKSVGICGATSTPEWLIHSIKDKINAFNF
ncbi:MAG TPA: 4-hydroxy-3-methylbut-2-enyl diphosphate reductase [Bacteroidales bacterium]|nr:4-hydroxy-3-methylbut-2-enyl diphosphate reductase [Bacteroidales bacterium]